MLQPLPVAVLLERIITVWPARLAVLMPAPGVYGLKVFPPSMLYSYTLVIVPLPPVPPVNVAERVWPTQALPAAISGIMVGATGCGVIISVPGTLLIDGVQPEPVNVNTHL